MLIVGADVGGTFTDIVAVGDGAVVSLKLPTSSPQSIAVAEGSFLAAVQPDLTGFEMAPWGLYYWDTIAPGS